MKIMDLYLCTPYVLIIQEYRAQSMSEWREWCRIIGWMICVVVMKKVN